MLQFCQSNGKYVTWIQRSREMLQERRKWTEEEYSGCVSVGVHLYSTGAAVECGRGPGYSAVTVNLNVDVQRHFKHPVIAANRE